MISNLVFEWRYLIGDTPWDTGISPPELIKFIDSHAPALALDLGCGTGTNAITLTQRGWNVVGIDSSYIAIRKARVKTRAFDIQIDFRRLDVSRLIGVHGQFDLILDIGCFHALSPRGRDRYCQRLAELISPGGTYLLYTWLEEPGSGVMAPSDAEIKARFSPMFPTRHQQLGTERERTSAWYTMQAAPA